MNFADILSLHAKLRKNSPALYLRLPQFDARQSLPTKLPGHNMLTKKHM